VTSSWAARVVLPGGQYEFVGRAKVVRWDALPGDRQAGACLRASVAGRLASRRLAATGGWEELRCWFTVRGPEDVVDLVCEFRAGGGEVWFDLASLQLRRAGPASRSGLPNLRR
jgi:hypothetical protein